MSAHDIIRYLDERSMPEPNSGCQLWLGAISENGYGFADWHGKKHRAHRLAWREKHGPIPDGMCICHKCDVRSCINPDHLFLGTRADNAADMISKGRSNRGSRHGRSKLTEVEALAIKRSLGTCQKVASDFNVGPMIVSLIRRGKNWRHLGDD